MDDLPFTPEKKGTDLIGFVDAMSRLGAAGGLNPRSTPIFPVPVRTVLFEREMVQAYEFKDATAIQERVEPDYFSKVRALPWRAVGRADALTACVSWPVS